VMSVMNGFQAELRSRILNVTSHAIIEGQEGSLPDWRNVQQKAASMPGVRSAVPYIEELAMLAAGDKASGARLRGVDPAQEEKATGIAGTVLEGSSLRDLVPGGYGVILGRTLAAELGVKLHDKVVFVVPRGSVTPFGIQPPMKKFTVVGFFSTGIYDYDHGLALMHIADAGRLLSLGDAVTGIRLSLDNPLQAPARVLQLANDLGGGYGVNNWTTEHASIFASIQMTKSLLFVILSMIVAIAAFNIVATLVMVVKDKETDIAILRTMGAGPRNVLRVFALQGVLIGTSGVAAGIALGALLSFNIESIIHVLESMLGTQFMDAQVYLMSDLPAQVQLGDVLQVTLLALVLCLLATIYPAWRASRVLPAEALRHD
jgi:lipoprotein-releasing system permease protein